MGYYELAVGAYTGGKPGKGAHLLRFDEAGLHLVKSWGPLTDPSYLQPVGGRVFAVEEMGGKAAVAELSLKRGEEGVRRFEIPGSGVCHITACGPYLYASGYAGGCLTGLRAEDGKTCCFLQHEGQGANPQRQERPHVHSAQPTPDGRHLLAADLGTDRLYQYDIGPKGELAPHAAQPWVETAPGQGPRHFAFHPSGEWLYLVTELDKSLLVYRYEPAESRLEYVEEHSLRGESCPPDALAADVHVSPDGGFVYASVRGSDRLFCFRTGEKGGRLTPAGDFSTGGREPRGFDLSPDGRFLAAANQTTGNVAVCPVDQRTGAVGAPAAVLDISQASCVKWM